MGHVVQSLWRAPCVSRVLSNADAEDQWYPISHAVRAVVGPRDQRLMLSANHSTKTSRSGWGLRRSGNTTL